MSCAPSFKSHFSRNNLCVLLLIAIWSAGIILGLHIAFFFCSSHYIYYYAAACEPAGFTGLLAVFFLPFLTVHLITRFKQTWLYVVIALKALTLGFDLAMVQFAFGRSAWLIRWFLQFSEFASSILLVWFALICMKAHKAKLKGYSIVYLITSSLLIIIDLLFISVFLSAIL